MTVKLKKKGMTSTVCNLWECSLRIAQHLIMILRFVESTVFNSAPEHSEVEEERDDQYCLQPLGV
jgi:hypothetical protein